jgi:sialidase-1
VKLIHRGNVASSSPSRPQNDTASLAELNGGIILVAWRSVAARSASILASRSADEGTTWEEPWIVFESSEDERLQAPALCALEDGSVLLGFLAWHRDLTTTFRVARSSDGGRRFSELSIPWQRSAEQRRQGGAPSIVRLRDGRLVLPFQGGGGYPTPQEHVTSSCLFSDDHGESWHDSLSRIDLPRRGAMEPSVAEALDGELLMSLRTQLGTLFAARSKDRGESWSAAQPLPLRSPESGTCLRRVSSGLVLAWNDAPYDPEDSHFGCRTPLSLAHSLDSGKTWSKVCDVEGGNFSLTNTDCLVTSTNQLLVTYNRGQLDGSSCDVALARIPVASVMEAS